MQVRHGEDLASHPGPESCAAFREGRGEALTRETTGQPCSREISACGMPTLFSQTEGHTVPDAKGKSGGGPPRSKTLGMSRRLLHRNWEISPGPAGGSSGRGGEGGKPQARPGHG